MQSILIIKKTNKTILIKKEAAKRSNITEMLIFKVSCATTWKTDLLWIMMRTKTNIFHFSDFGRLITVLFTVCIILISFMRNHLECSSLAVKPHLKFVKMVFSTRFFFFMCLSSSAVSGVEVVLVCSKHLCSS